MVLNREERNGLFLDASLSPAIFSNSSRRRLADGLLLIFIFLIKYLGFRPCVWPVPESCRRRIVLIFKNKALQKTPQSLFPQSSCGGLQERPVTTSPLLLRSSLCNLSLSRADSPSFLATPVASALNSAEAHTHELKKQKDS